MERWWLACEPGNGVVWSLFERRLKSWLGGSYCWRRPCIKPGIALESSMYNDWLAKRYRKPFESSWKESEECKIGRTNADQPPLECFGEVEAGSQRWRKVSGLMLDRAPRPMQGLRSKHGEVSTLAGDDLPRAEMANGRCTIAASFVSISTPSICGFSRPETLAL